MIDSIERTSREETYQCGSCDDFAMEKRYEGMAGTAGEAEHEEMTAPDECPVCGGEIEVQ